jgi:hypothetical protein
MRVNLEIQPGQETRGDKLTISEVLAEYLRAEKRRLAPKTHARYTEVIALFTHSLNSYAANSLGRFERARFDKLFNAEGEQHRESIGVRSRCSGRTGQRPRAYSRECR